MILRIFLRMSSNHFLITLLSSIQTQLKNHRKLSLCCHLSKIFQLWSSIHLKIVFQSSTYLRKLTFINWKYFWNDSKNWYTLQQSLQDRFLLILSYQISHLHQMLAYIFQINLNNANQSLYHRLLKLFINLAFHDRFFH